MGGGDLFKEAALAAGLLGHKNLGIAGVEHGDVQLLRERPLDRIDMGGGQPRLPAGGHTGLHRQHPGIDPLGVVRQSRISSQFLAAGGQQDVARQGFQHFHSLGGGIRKEAPFRQAAVPQQPQIGGIGFFTGRADIFRYNGGIGMGGIDDAVKLPLPEQLLHLIFIQPLGGHLHPGDLLQQLAAVFRGRAGENLRLPRQALHQLPPVRRSGEYTELIHPGSLWGSPNFHR